MIPIAHITQWRQYAPWSDDAQVEQDLILSRIIVAIFSNPLLAEEIAFRGGTALHKLFFSPSARYSEDIDLVRTSSGPIKKTIDTLRNVLDPWLGEPKTKRNEMLFVLCYSFVPEASPNSKMRIKIEINTRETFSIHDHLMKSFKVTSNWFTGEATVRTFELEELIATKLCVLYQRKKGRDLFDLWLALKEENFNTQKTVHIFQAYMRKQNLVITKKDFEENLKLKLQESSFVDDINRLLSPPLKESQSKSIVTDDGESITTNGWNLHEAARNIKNRILIYL